MGKNVVIVGGGFAGLAASIFLARGGRTVTLFEKRRYLGGRAITHLRHGFRFNLGPHAFYRGGAGSAVLRELGIRTMRLLSNNPRKLVGIEAYGLSVTEWLPLEIPASESTRKYLKAKKDKLGHKLSSV